MKAIKDCEWLVSFKCEGTLKDTIARWVAKSLYSDATIKGDRYYKSETTLKKEWERFAKLNKIKKWRYV